MSQNEVLNLRLVCQDWRKEIDDHYGGWKIQIDDKSPYLKLLLELRVTKCAIINFSKSSPLGPEKIFKNPDLVKDIEISEDCDEYFEIISPQNLHYLLKSCFRNLKTLTLSLTENLLNNPCSSENFQGYSFQNLRILIITLQKDKPDTMDTPLSIQEDSLLHQIITAPMPKLSTINVICDVQLSQSSDARVAYDVLGFITRHGKILEQIVYQNHWYGDEESPVDFSALDFHTIDLSLLKKVNQLKTFEITLSTVKVMALKNAWKLLLDYQTKLEDCKVYDLPISSVFLKHILTSNFGTLNSIEIGELVAQDIVLIDGNERRVFDMSVFRNCVNLLSLNLDNNEYNVQPHIGRPMLQNLSRLPPQLKLLDLSEFSICSEDVLEFIRNHRSLYSVAFRNCWCLQDGPNCGINGTIMEELMSERCALLTEIDIDSFTTAHQDELMKLIQLLGRFDYPNNPSLDNYFPVSLYKDPISNTWKRGMLPTGGEPGPRGVIIP